MEEVWKDVEGYEGCYQVSNMGRVRSLTRKVHNYMKPGRILKQYDNGHHYQYVGMSDGKEKRKHVYVHILVAKAFIPNEKNYEQVNHKDFNKRNNAVDNLEWVSREQNISHFRKSEYYKKIEEQRERIFRSKIVKRIYEEKDKIIAAYTSGMSIKETAKHTGNGRDFVIDVLRLYEYV